MNELLSITFPTRSVLTMQMYMITELTFFTRGDSDSLSGVEYK